MSARAVLGSVLVEMRLELTFAIRDAVVDLLSRRDVWVAISAVSSSAGAMSPWLPREDDPLGPARPPTPEEIAANVGRLADALRAESRRAR